MSKKVQKTYFGVPKQNTADDTVYYWSGENAVAEIGGATGVTCTYKASPTGLGAVISASANAIPLNAKPFTIGFWYTSLLSNNENMLILSGNVTKTLTKTTDFSITDLKPHFCRIIVNVNGDINVYVDGILKKTYIAFFSTVSSVQLLNNNGIIADFAINNSDLGNLYQQLPKDFLSQNAKIAPAFNPQRRNYTDALSSQFTTAIAKGATNAHDYGLTVSKAGANWASGDTIKVKGMAGSIISGVIDSDTALAVVTSNVSSSATVQVDKVDNLAVNDTVVISRFIHGGIESVTITAIDTANKTITINKNVNLSIGDLVVETTASSSSPTAKFMNGSTLTNVTGTWAGLGTTEATFTLGTNASLTNQDIQIEYSLNNPVGQGQTEVFTKILGGEVNGRKLTPSTVVKITDDFKGKIAGSSVECTHISKYGGTPSLQNPSGSLTEFANDRYTKLFMLDNINASEVASTNGNISQQLFSFNIIEIIERKLGMKIPSVNPVQWCKDNISKIVCNWHGYGSCPSGNKANFSLWLNNAWTSGTNALSHINASISKLMFNQTDSWVTNTIDSNGFTHYLAYTEASNGTVASTIYTDYINIEIELKVPSSFDAVLTFENPRVDDSYKVINGEVKKIRQNILLLQTKTRTVQTMFEASNEDRIAIWGQYEPMRLQTFQSLDSVLAVSDKLYVITEGTGGINGNTNSNYNLYKACLSNFNLNNVLNLSKFVPKSIFTDLNLVSDNQIGVTKLPIINDFKGDSATYFTLAEGLKTGKPVYLSVSTPSPLNNNARVSVLPYIGVKSGQVYLCMVMKDTTGIDVGRLDGVYMMTPLSNNPLIK